MKILVSSTPSRLGFVNQDALIALLKNPRGACNFITVEALESLSWNQLQYMTPDCLAAMKNLASLNLSRVLFNMPENIFSKYNGPLSEDTIGGMTSEQIKLYGSLVKDGTLICSSLDLSLAHRAVPDLLTASCLYGYLNQKHEGPLTTLWLTVSPSTLLLFTMEMRQVWANIHSDDIFWMPPIIRKIILSSHHSCKNRKLSFLDPNTIKDVSISCLQRILSDNGPEASSLGELWGYVEENTVSSFAEEIVTILSKISPIDIPYMPSWILQIFLTLETTLNNLRLGDNNLIVILPPWADQLKFTPSQFNALARASPTLAGQFLLVSNKLPDDILVDCDGYTIRKLYYGVPGRVELDWKSLFVELEKKPNWSPIIISLMSVKSDVHLCSTISNLEEYLSLAWLRRNMNGNCRSVLALDFEDVQVYLKAKELFHENTIIPPWQKMLREYNLVEWGQITSIPWMANYLGSNCHFWFIVSSIRPDILKVISSLTWKSIKPLCVYHLRDFLRERIDLIPLLPANAFSMYGIGEMLPCKLWQLGHEQIAQLSIGAIVNYKNPSDADISQHVLAGITIDEFKSLRPTQFGTIFKYQWKFVPKVFKAALKSKYFQKTIAQLEKFLHGRVEDGGVVTHGLSLPQGLKSLELLAETLCLYLAISNKTRQTQGENERPNWKNLFNAIEKSKYRNELITMLGQSIQSRQLKVALSHNVSQFRGHLLESFDWRNNQRAKIEIPFDRKTGFDRIKIIQLFETSPESLSRPLAFVSSQGLEDQGGPMRLLIDQILTDINRDLINPTSQTIIGQKFTWGTSHKMGLIVGVTLGKAIQLDMKLPFVLDSGFYNLLIDNSDDSIRKYYETTYDHEISLFKREVLKLKDQEPDLKTLLEMLTKVEKIRFTMISTKWDAQEAAKDFLTKTNIWSCGTGEGFHEVQQLIEEGDFLQEYLYTINSLLSEEFKKFVRELIKGFTMTLPLMKTFPATPLPMLRTFTHFLPMLLNAKPPTADSVIERIEFNFDALIGSFKEGRFILASKVIFAFIRSLEEGQIGHFIAIWTGSSTASMDYTNLKVTLVEPSGLEPVKFNFCQDATPELAKDMPIISPGEQYLELFRKFIQKLNDDDVELGFEPDCSEGGVEMLVGRSSTCSKSLLVYLQPAQSLFNGLVFLLNTMLRNIRDD